MPASRNPARNAPISLLKPIALVPIAAPSATAADTTSTSSALPTFATKPSTRGSRYRPPKIITVIPPRLIPAADMNSAHAGRWLDDTTIAFSTPDHRASGGSSAITTTLNRSCTIATPTVTRPCGVRPSRRVISTRTATAVDDIDSAIAITSPRGAVTPPMSIVPQLTSVTRMVEIATTARIGASPRRIVETSRCRPMANISRMIASWEIDSTAAGSRTMPIACGPTSTPASRYPGISSSLRRRNSVATSAEVASITRSWTARGACAAFASVEIIQAPMVAGVPPDLLQRSTRTISSVRSAGVMPSRRPACPNVRGRKRASDSRASMRSCVKRR